MTEMTVIKNKLGHNLWMPAPRPARYLIDPVAFFIALIGGPVLATLLTFWALFIPVLALFLGGPVYLILGTPLLLIYLRGSLGETRQIMAIALFAVLSLVPAGLAVWAISGDKAAMIVVLSFVPFGVVFGPLWAWGFGWIYFRLRRDFYTHPLPTHF